LTELSAEVPRVLTQIGEASKTATEIQKIDLEFLARRIAERFRKASEMADVDRDDDSLSQLDECLEGVQTEIVRARLILDKLAKKV
jgi:hypothetical protein